MKLTTLVTALLLPQITTVAHAGPRTSANYTVATDANDAGGQRTASGLYTNDGSLGGIVGISTSANDTAKQGYVGQLTDVTGLTITAASPNVNETATSQLTAKQALDDGTFLSVPATSVAWSVASGPITSISASGLATAGVVYENTTAIAQGIFAGDISTLSLTVVDAVSDNFGTYAGDNLSDAWQVEYFGLDNPQAAPLIDADGDGYNNRFEHHASLIPTDPLSTFRWRAEPVPGQPLQIRLIFSPRFVGSTYTVKTSTDLASNDWISLSGATISDNGEERTVLDPNPNGQRRFYRVEVTKP